MGALTLMSPELLTACTRLRAVQFGAGLVRGVAPLGAPGKVVEQLCEVLRSL